MMYMYTRYVALLYAQCMQVTGKEIRLETWLAYVARSCYKKTANKNNQKLNLKITQMIYIGNKTKYCNLHLNKLDRFMSETISNVAKSVVFPQNWATLTLFLRDVFPCPRIEATPITWYLAPGLLSGEPRQTNLFFYPTRTRFLPGIPSEKRLG